jgi:ribosomal-protein-alanine N-acetyltransferase
MTPAFLRAILAGDPAGAEAILGARISRELTPPLWILEMRLKMIEDDPAQAAWLTRAIVLMPSGEVIGSIGFHEKPGGESLRPYCDFGVEAGYEIDEAFRRQGFAREAFTGLTRWAHYTHGVESFFLSISPENGPSLAMAKSLGFRLVGSQIDEIDGLEHVFRGDAGTDLRWLESSSHAARRLL